MNPLVSSFIGSLVRWLLTGLAGYFVKHGVITGEESTAYLAALVVGAPVLLWSLWEKYNGKLLLHTALHSPATTVAAVEKAVEHMDAPDRINAAFASKGDV